MVESELLAPFERMLASLFSPEAVRSLERGKDSEEAWKELAESGFLDALVSEEHGGAGLVLADILPLWLALGRHAVPLPVAETMVARALLAGGETPDGPLALADIDPANAPPCGIDALAGLVRAAIIAGAAGRLLDLTVAYANERVQFGRPIGKQQAVQQQLAVMAEEVVAVRLAVETAGATTDPWPTREAAACAKANASAAAPRIAGIAHAVHGAIGISEEYDLQLFTRLLHAQRLADGSETLWNRELGTALLDGDTTVLDFLRERVFD